MSKPPDDQFKEFMDIYNEACGDLPAGEPGLPPAAKWQPGESPKSKGKKPRRPKAKRSKVILGRQLRDTSDIDHVKVPPELRFDPEKVHIDSLVVEQLCDVKEQAVEWLWPGRLPLGRLSLLAGDPGIGKSLVALDIAARVSCGAPWPDTPDVPRKPANVLVFSMEDDLRDTIKPRLLRAGADSQRTFVVEGVFNCPPYPDLQWKRRFRIREDILSVLEMCKEFPTVQLIVFDPIAAYCGNGDGCAMSIVHSMLAPLLDIAARFGIAVLCTTHLSRGSSGKAVYRAANRLSFTTAARAVWSIVRDAVVPEKRLMVPVKLNLAPDVSGLAFRIDGEGKVAWERDPVRMSADRAYEAEREASKLERTTEWLHEVLQDGPHPAAEVVEKGIEQGFSETTIRRAAKILELHVDLKGFSTNRESNWSLPNWSPSNVV